MDNGVYYSGDNTSASTDNNFAEQRRLIDGLGARIDKIEKNELVKIVRSLLKTLKMVCILFPILFLIILGLFLLLDSTLAPTFVLGVLGGVVVIVAIAGFFIKK